jgi:hypothetical protein
MISMIHNSSSDPVLIKKISLKIWSLRDEIEARIHDKLEAGTPSADLDLMEIHNHYSPKHLQNDNVLSLKPNAELDTGEDEMARAMAQAEAEEAAGAEETPAESEEVSENVIGLTPQTPPANVVSIDQNIISISLDAPNIPEDKVSKGKTVLSEISMDKMFFFCNKPFTEGQSIVIQFCIPKSFIVNADILYCRPFNLKSRIISQNNYTHRALIRFNFLKEGERALLRQFLQSIEPDIVKVEKKAEPSKSENDGSDFGELDDLGL